MGRREMLAKAVRRHQQKQQAPGIVVIPPWGGGEPMAVWALDRRKPTEAELAAAFIAAGYPEDKSKAAAARIAARDRLK